MNKAGHNPIEEGIYIYHTQLTRKHSQERPIVETQTLLIKIK